MQNAKRLIVQPIPLHLVTLILCVFVFGVISAVRPSLKEFEGSVIKCRLEMRKYCAVVQDLMKSPEVGKRKKGKALRHLQKAQERWKDVEVRYGKNPPSEYEKDEKFGERLLAILRSFKDMERELKGKSFKKSFQACAKACGMFVKMHEENGLDYALDRIYHLRKAAKNLVAKVKDGDKAEIEKHLPDVLSWRNQASKALCPHTTDKYKCLCYSYTVDKLSEHIDELAIAVMVNNEKKIEALSSTLLKKINLSYAAAMRCTKAGEIEEAEQKALDYD